MKPHNLLTRSYCMTTLNTLYRIIYNNARLVAAQDGRENWYRSLFCLEHPVEALDRYSHFNKNRFLRNQFHVDKDTSVLISYNSKTGSHPFNCFVDHITIFDNPVILFLNSRRNAGTKKSAVKEIFDWDSKFLLNEIDFPIEFDPKSRTVSYPKCVQMELELV